MSYWTPYPLSLAVEVLFYSAERYDSRTWWRDQAITYAKLLVLCECITDPSILCSVKMRFSWQRICSAALNAINCKVNQFSTCWTMCVSVIEREIVGKLWSINYVIEPTNIKHLKSIELDVWDGAQYAHRWLLNLYSAIRIQIMTQINHSIILHI